MRIGRLGAEWHATRTFLLFLTSRARWKVTATFPVWPPPLGQEPAASTPEWIFKDPRSRAPLDEIKQAAPSDVTMLTSGETDTGKGLIARYLHNRSVRQGGPFVMVSCDAFFDTLVDTELLGHENGASVGAFGMQVGWFEQADGGTTFPDEISDLPLPVQNKLLCVSQEREIVCPGGRMPISVDLWVVAATTIDLETSVREKRFHKNLHCRLNAVDLDALTLKERPGDIIPLACYFISAYSKRLGHACATLIPATERLLTQSPRHNNMRELESVIHRTLLLYDGNTTDVPELKLSSCSVCIQAQTETGPPIACATASITQLPVPYSIDETDLLCQAIQHLCNDSVRNVYQLVEDTLFREVFRYCHYSQSDAARILDASRNVVWARPVRLGEADTPYTSSFAAKPGTPTHEDVMST